jgi:CTP synthase
MFMPEGDKEQMGGTMRLGARETILTPNSLAHDLYGKENISERHRHRYEVNSEYVKLLEKNGLIFSGKNMDAESNGERMEVVELPDLKFFIAAQYHPEFQSRPNRPSPLFLGLLKASTNNEEPSLKVEA